MAMSNQSTLRYFYSKQYDNEIESFKAMHIKITTT